MTKKAPTKELELKVEYVDIDSIIPYINNAKLHPPEQIAQIAASIKEFGFNDAIAIDETNTIISGHGRLLAAQKLKLKTVPIVRLNHLSPAQKKAYIIAHNKLTMNTGFDNAMLKLDLEFLKEQEFNLDLTGFTIDDLADLDLEINSPKDEFVPNLPSENNDNTTDKVYKLIVMLENEEQQQELFDDLNSQGYKVKAG